MKKLALLLVSVMILTQAAAQASGWDRVREIFGGAEEEPVYLVTKVLINDRTQGDMLEITGSYNIYDPATHKKLGSRFGDKRYFIQPTASGIKWGEQFPGVYQVEIIPDDIEQTTILLGGIQYKGSMLVYQIGQQLSFINVVPIEDYVNSQVSKAAEGQDLNDEALAALTIVTRTNALYEAQRNPGAYWFVKAQEVGYEGYGVVDPNVERISDYTKGLVMKNHEYGNLSGVFAALWTEDSAGHTAPYQVIFRHQASSPDNSVGTPFAGQHRDESKWAHTFTKAHLAERLETGYIKDVEAYRDDSSGKVYGIEVTHSEGEQSFDYETLIAKLGTDTILSSDFTIESDVESVTFTGHGKGHGVGLCLYSANVMASYGKDAPEILREFFPGSELVVVNPHEGMTH